MVHKYFLLQDTMVHDFLSQSFSTDSPPSPSMSVGDLKDVNFRYLFESYLSSTIITISKAKLSLELKAVWLSFGVFPSEKKSQHGCGR